MPKYQYEAVSVSKSGTPVIGGQKFRGIVEAQSGEYAILELARRQLYPLSIRQMSQTDEVVAGRLINYKRIKEAFTPGMAVGVRMPASSAAPRFRMPWEIIAWGAIILGILWAITR